MANISLIIFCLVVVLVVFVVVIGVVAIFVDVHVVVVAVDPRNLPCPCKIYHHFRSTVCISAANNRYPPVLHYFPGT